MQVWIYNFIQISCPLVWNSRVYVAFCAFVIVLHLPLIKYRFTLTENLNLTSDKDKSILWIIHIYRPIELCIYHASGKKSCSSLISILNNSTRIKMKKIHQYLRAKVLTPILRIKRHDFIWTMWLIIFSLNFLYS